MESGAIPNSHIKASTEQTGYEAWRGRLNNGKAWQTNTADTDQWLQIDLGSHKVITGIQTQGLWGYHIKSYKLMFSDDASTWVTYGDGQDDTVSLSTIFANLAEFASQTSASFNKLNDSIRHLSEDMKSEEPTCCQLVIIRSTAGLVIAVATFFPPDSVLLVSAQLHVVKFNLITRRCSCGATSGTVANYLLHFPCTQWHDNHIPQLSIAWWNDRYPSTPTSSLTVLQATIVL
ncbi:DCBLD2 [Branchiostoma lanceolatum]|uniref:DCBLD2 protein n=1 Tax=Branchiostoma lanceolatum TaxID=7740 RepID=A0A8S4MMC2_BRALA|nr:DCBLD2 [Branchiostoma lanceolatum]